ncbi:MAG: serine hydrolase domain-containing protein [Flavobacteriaceae bacterium]
MLRFHSLIWVITLTFAGPLWAQRNLNPSKLVDFENYLKAEIEAKQIAGVEVLIYQDQELRWHKALGYTNVKTQAPLEKNSLYFIQSMTKPIMSVAIMQLIEKGLLSLDDLAQDFIPELKNLRVIKTIETGIEGATVELKQAITIRQLLTHTAGLSHGLEDHLFDRQLFKLMYNDLFDPAIYKKLEEPVAKLLSVPLIGQPGEQWYYSAAPDVLALILQKITQQPIDQYLQEHIFTPLEMNDTGYNVTSENTKRVMAVHLKNEDGELIPSPVQARTSSNTVYGGTYGLFSSTTDYLKFCQMILNKGTFNGKRILSPGSIVQMTKNQVGELIGPGRGFGLGFGVLYNTDNDPSPANTGQIYWGGFFKTHFFIDPSERIIALIMTQKIPNTKEYIIALNRAVYGALEN